MLTLWRGCNSWILILSRCPCCDSDHLDLVYLMMRTQSARASQCISSPSHPVACTHPPLIYPLGFHHLVFSPPCFPPIFLLCMVAFLIEGFRCRYPHLCVCQRNTCCLILHSRIAELSCLLNLLTTLDYFIPALFHHIFTHPHRTFIHSHRSPSFPFSWAPVSPPTQYGHACTHSTNGVNHSPFNCFSMSRHFHTSHQPTTTLSLPSSTVSPPHQCHSLV